MDGKSRKEDDSSTEYFFCLVKNVLYPPSRRTKVLTIFRLGSSNRSRVIQITDAWCASRHNEIGMISRSAMRRSLSLVLSLAVGLWANSGWVMPPAADLGSKCHTQKVQMHQHASHSLPCCPSHPAPAPTQSTNHPGCCDMSGQPARPLVFLVVSGRSRSLPLSASAAAGTILRQLRSRSALPSIEQTSRFVRPVFELKTDLRI
jgi:hypothetical protein